MPRIAAVQEPPVYYDLEATLSRGVELVGRAAGDGIELLVFPEAWFSGYPDFIWALAPGNDQDVVAKALDRFRRGAVDLARDGLAPIRKAARDHGVVVVAGLTERASEASTGTLYNSAVTIDATGDILNVHRKVMPTRAERLVWGFGDARGMNVVETAVGRVGVLICWENYMPLARAAMWAQNVEICAAPTADEISDGFFASMRHIAREGGVWTISANIPLHDREIAPDLPGAATLPRDAEGWIRRGGAIVCAPDGAIAAGPMQAEKGLLVADADFSAIAEWRQYLDVVGHYARPDLFSLTVDRSPQEPVRFR